MIHSNMKRLAAALAFSASLASSAHALNQTWVASNGNDSNACDRNAPCLTLIGAYGKTSPEGEISCVDSVPLTTNLNVLIVTTAVTINCEGVVTSAGNNGLFIIINTAASDRVVLRGLSVDARGASGAPIIFKGAGTLIVDRMKMSGARFDASDARPASLYFAPTGVGKLVVTDSLLVKSGNGTIGGGIIVKPEPGGTAQVLLSRVNVSGNTFGIAIDGSNSTGGINATIIDSVMASNQNDGVVATSSPSTAPIGVTVIDSASTNNGFGIRSIGSNVTVRVEGSKIIGNGNGLSGGGALITGGGNTVQGNASNGAFTGSYALQ